MENAVCSLYDCVNPILLDYVLDELLLVNFFGFFANVLLWSKETKYEENSVLQHATVWSSPMEDNASASK